MDNIVSGSFVIDDVGSPETAEALVSQPQHFLTAPVNQVVGLPHNQTFAAASGNFLPGIVILIREAVGQAQVGGKDNKFTLPGTGDM